MSTSKELLSLAVVTGGHAFDVPNFHRLFRRLDWIDAYIQTMGDFASSPQATRDGYTGVVFYHMLKGAQGNGPADEGQPWFEGKPRAAIERLKETGQGIVVLHHSLLAYPGWAVWRELTGVDPALKSYHHDQQLSVQVVGGDHPVTAGLENFILVDETYRMGEPDAGNTILFTTDHPHSLRALAWARSFGRSRVFCLALGHDDQAWSNLGFERVLARGIRWTVDYSNSSSSKKTRGDAGW